MAESIGQTIFDLRERHVEKRMYVFYDSYNFNCVCIFHEVHEECNRSSKDTFWNVKWKLLYGFDDWSTSLTEIFDVMNLCLFLKRFALRGIFPIPDWTWLWKMCLFIDFTLEITSRIIKWFTFLIIFVNTTSHTSNTQCIMKPQK